MKATVPIKKDKPDDYSKGHRDLRLPDGDRSAAFAGREAQNENRGHLKEKLYDIRGPTIEAITGECPRRIAVSHACIGATLSADKSSVQCARDSSSLSH